MSAFRLHPTLRFLVGLQSWRARFFFVLTQIVSRLSPPPKLKYLLRAQVYGRYANDGIVAYFRPSSLDAWLCHPMYERQTRAWLDEHLPPDSGVMIDVGAHCGSFLLRHRHAFETIYALEPSPDDYDALVMNAELTQARHVVPIKMAAGAKAGRMHLYINTPGTNSLVGASGQPYVDVDVITLDNLLAQRSTRPQDVGLLKIDVEGAEVQVLEGSRRLLVDGAPLIVVEANTPEHARALREFVEPLGYRQQAVLDVRNLIFKKDDALDGASAVRTA